MTDISMLIIALEVLKGVQGVCALAFGLIVAARFFVLLDGENLLDMNFFRTMHTRTATIVMVVSLICIAFIPSKKAIMTVAAIEYAADIEGIEKIPQGAVDYINKILETK